MVTPIVGCSATKRDSKQYVWKLYDSAYFDKRFTAAMALYGTPKILSAKHGVVEVTEKVAPYDVKMSSLSVDERQSMADEIDTSSWDEHVVVFAGVDYVDVIERAVESDQTVEKVLEGGIGEQLSQLNEMIHNA